ncbi:hypothetical protein DSO57_1036546 [Entomophthora muscae]|uniref:Uncharacterized protein n=1 Tax=Entomophthora muscae TaxID=34485 RepID=A0ACC2SCR8_9FUNG|nr:hypothetical protein DSO57_1036546 [Entomophthora muscae]
MQLKSLPFGAGHDIFPNTPSATNGAHYRGPMYLSVEEDIISPPPLLTGFHERYNGAPMETSNIERDCWLLQEEEIIDVNNLPIISDSRCAELPIASLN